MIGSLQNNIQNDVARLSMVGDKVDPWLGHKIHINIILLKVQ